MAYPHMPRCPTVNGTPSTRGVLGDVRRDVLGAQPGDQLSRVVAPVQPNRLGMEATFSQFVYHGGHHRTFRSAARGGMDGRPVPSAAYSASNWGESSAKAASANCLIVRSGCLA